MATPTDPKAIRTPTGGAPMMKIRRPRAADPLVRPKRRPPPGRTAGANPAANGAPASRPAIPAQTGIKNATEPQPIRLPRPNIRQDATVNGFSGSPLSASVTDYPLVTTKRALREGLKHHVAKFISKKTIDPRNEAEFTRPVRLQRRDPRARPAEPDALKQENARQAFGTANMDEAEREEFEAKKAAREKEREENLAQIAPSAATAQKKTNFQKPKTQQVMKADMTAEEIAKARIKYEEALPWHLEDFDNRNAWVGNYEAALSETYAMFVLEPTGKMRMVPIDKWYRFNARTAFKTLTIEEAEKFMSKKVKDPRWFMEKQQETLRQKELDAYAKQSKVYRGKKVDTAGLDGDDMDFEEDRFADDEEVDAGLFEEDEDTKAAERRIKQDQLKANVFSLKEEKDYDEEELREKKEKEARKVLGKKVRKALQRREKNFDYSSGSDVNPYSDDESSDEDSDAENVKEEDKKTEDEKAIAKEKEKESGASTKGTSTPSGRPKHTDPLKKVSGIGRKRIGSPNLSDASGTDTSRKKPKHAATGQAIPSPNSALAASKKRIRVGGPGSGSDLEGGVTSGADLSDTGKAKKLKLNLSRAGTPLGSRSGSPAPLRAGTPDGGHSALKGPLRVSTPRPSQQPQTFPTPAEIHAAIPASGIASRDLLKIFHSRIGESKENHRRFIAIVRDVGVYGKEDRLLRPGVLKET